MMQLRLESVWQMTVKEWLYKWVLAPSQYRAQLEKLVKRQELSNEDYYESFSTKRVPFYILDQIREEIVESAFVPGFIPLAEDNLNTLYSFHYDDIFYDIITPILENNNIQTDKVDFSGFDLRSIKTVNDIALLIELCLASRSNDNQYLRAAEYFS